MSSTLDFKGRQAPMRRSLRFLVPAAGLFVLLLYITNVQQLYRSSISSPISKVQLSAAEGNNSTDSAGDAYRFVPPEASIQTSVVRGDLTLWTAENKTWHVLSRPPTRPECWTYKDRYGAYEKPTAEMSNIISNHNLNNSNPQKRAIILRLSGGQAWKPRFVSYVRSLVMEAGHIAGYDIIIYIHLDLDDKEKLEWLRRIPQEFKLLVQTFSTQDLKNWLPPPASFKNVYEQNHTPIQMFMSKNKKYDFVYSIENDVRLIGRWDHFLADVDAEYAFHLSRKSADQQMPPSAPDLLSFQTIRRPRPQWPWFQKEDACIARFGGKANTRSSLGVMWGWSRKLTDAMTAYNEEGINCYFEYFAPSVAHQMNLTTFWYQHPLYCPEGVQPDRHSLKMEDFGRNDPRLVQGEDVAVGCSYFFVDSHSKLLWDPWYHNPEICRPPALVHPVKGNWFN